MSKSIKIEEDAFRACRVYRGEGRQKIHEDYGLWVISAIANARFSTGFNRPVPRFYEFYSLSHLTKGHAWLWIKGRGKQDVAAGDIIIVEPNVVHDYKGYDCYEEDYVCFAGPVADYLARSGIIETGVFPFGKVRRLLSICEFAGNPGRYSQIKANIALQKLLVDSYLERREGVGGRQGHLMDDLLQAIMAHPEEWWPVSRMAEITGLSINQLIRVFHNHTGLTPKCYIDQLKAKLASEMLVNSSESLSSIANSLGFSDQFHFSKRFKALTGLAPSDYRKYRFKTRTSDAVDEFPASSNSDC